MRALSNCLFLFGLQQQQQQQQRGHSVFVPALASSGATGTSTQPFFLTEKVSKEDEEKNAKVQELFDAITRIGQVGSLASDEDQKLLEELASKVVPYSEPNPAKYPLSGQHTLLYSAAPGASSGRIFGTVVGKVNQFFEDDDIFYNRVEFVHPKFLQIALKAQREIKNDSTIKVTFLETKISLFGTEITSKQMSGGGAWKCKFIGPVYDQSTQQEKLLRIMETPSLFIIEQPLEE